MSAPPTSVIDWDMTREHTILYVLGRVAAATLNFAAMIVFARLAGPETYGQYLVLLALSLVANGVTLQWLRYSFFTAYREADAPTLIATYLRLVMAAVIVSIAVAVALQWSGLFDKQIIAGVFVIAIGMASFDALVEISRLKLQVRVVAFATILRAVLTLGLGAASLILFPHPLVLAAAVGIANIVAALPATRAAWSAVKTPASSEVARAYVGYGWPLAFSFAIAALGAQAERLMLAGMEGSVALGQYGALGDFLRQGFAVLGEAIMMALVTIAKREASEGRDDTARDVLLLAFKCFLFLFTFGFLFFLIFGERLFMILYGPVYVAGLEPTIPLIVLAAAILMMRNYYYAQAMFFSRASWLEVATSLVALVVVVASAYVLIPLYAAHGAALAQLIGQLVALGVIVVLSRRYYRMPFAAPPIVVCLVVGVVVTVLCEGIEPLLQDTLVKAAIQLVVFGVGALVAFVRLGLLGVIPGLQAKPDPSSPGR